MSKIKYKIQFYSEWHCGSGLAAGADVDALVIKDNDKLPFVPGKTIKGLLREAVEVVNQFSKEADKVSDKDFVSAFGIELNDGLGTKGSLFFTNAELSDEEHKTIADNKATQYMYRSIASTAINEEGIADEHSLRKIEVVVPCSLEGEILNVDNKVADIIIMSFGYVKRLGQNRNRGLGRCNFQFVAKED